MPNRTAKFRSALLAGFLAGATLTTAPDNAARAANDCLSAPKEQTPQGSHWHYRIERGTGRHCWYLREENDTQARAAPRDSSPSANPVSPPRAAATQRSVADARAELPMPQTRIEQAPGIGQQPSAATVSIAGNENSPRASAGDADRPASVVATRWPDTSGNPAPVNQVAAAPSTSTVATSAVANSTEPASTAVPPPAVAAVPLAAADATASGKPSGSILMLLTVGLGALSVAGVIASAIFRIGGKRRSRRREIWGDRPWASPDADPALPPAYRHPRELREGTSARRGPRSLDESNDRIADFFTEISRRAPT